MTHSAAVSRLPVLSSIVGLALLASSCATSGLAFVQDDRVEIIAPKSHEKVTLPVTVRWRVDGFRVTGNDGRSDPNAGYFGIFVDRAPVPPGKTLDWIARDDKRCLANPECPNALYFADRDIYATSATEFRFDQLPDQGSYRGNEVHEVSIVLLDGTGRRIGESAWYVTLRYDRDVS
jgi:hypothetical protein